MADDTPKDWQDKPSTQTPINSAELERIEKQLVPIFSNSTARGAQITSPEEGQLAFLEDINLFTWYDGSAWRILTPQLGLTQLTNDAAASASTWEQWGTEVITFSDPGHPIVVQAEILGNVSIAGQGGQIRVASRVEISLDGGSTWTAGNGPRVEMQDSAPDEILVGGFHQRSGTPTGDVKVRGMLWTDTVGGPDPNFQAGTVKAQMLGAMP